MYASIRVHDNLDFELSQLYEYVPILILINIDYIGKYI